MRPLLALLSMVALGLLTSVVQMRLAGEPPGTARPVGPADAPLSKNAGAASLSAEPLSPTQAGGAAGGVRVADAVERYAVEGTSEAELLASLVADGPRIGSETFFGLTVTQLSFRFWRQSEGDRCALRNVAVDLSVTTTLPAWTPPPEAAADLRRDWTRFETALARHEAHHRTMAVAWAGRVRVEIEGIDGPTCFAAEAEARRRVDRLRIEADAEHRRYDAETGHGLTEGATWPLPR